MGFRIWGFGIQELGLRVWRTGTMEENTRNDPSKELPVYMHMHIYIYMFIPVRYGFRV